MYIIFTNITTLSIFCMLKCSSEYYRTFTKEGLELSTVRVSTVLFVWAVKRLYRARVRTRTRPLQLYIPHEGHFTPWWGDRYDSTSQPKVPSAGLEPGTSWLLAGHLYPLRHKLAYIKNVLYETYQITWSRSSACQWNPKLNKPNPRYIRISVRVSDTPLTERALMFANHQSDTSHIRSNRSI